jgi:hypothetical protein
MYIILKLNAMRTSCMLDQQFVMEDLHCCYLIEIACVFALERSIEMVR